ncbi:MAG: SIMPL domain-containing protein [Candidatus Liptonbacteria bacterium]|nr:SIMPL domain-containing protein [Candidatus Liptonbacteria bacterium]
METEQYKKYFWALLDILIVGIVINLVFFVMPAVSRYGRSLNAARTLSVSATGKTFAAPDIAESSFSVVSRGKNPDELADANNQKISAAISFLKSSGVDAKDIKTTGYHLSPDYRYDPQTERNFIAGYTMTQTVTVKIRDLSNAAKIVGGITPLGINQIGGISFKVDDEEKFVSEARADAFAKAKRKASDIAARSGVRLGRVMSVVESQGGVPIPYYGGGIAALAKESALPTLEPGTEEVTDQVTVTYELK